MSSTEPVLRLDPLSQLHETSIGVAPGRGRLQGRRVLVIGAGERPHEHGRAITGNGRAMSLVFAREGAEVICADIDLGAAEATVADITAEGGQARAAQADIASVVDMDRLFAECGGAQALYAAVANVGISTRKPLAEQTPEMWDKVLATNLRGHMLMAQRCLSALQPGGAMLFVSSAASVSPLGRNPSYEASKAALSALARSSALEGQPLGLRANVLAPGLLDTPMGRSASQANKARATRPVPFGRQGTGWEMAYAVLFLISPESSYVNAQTLLLDGGANSNVVSPFRSPTDDALPD